MPRLSCVSTFVEANSGIGIGGEVRFTGSSVNRVGVFLIERQRAEVEYVLVAPACTPRLARVVAQPDTAAGSTGKDPFRMSWMTGKGSNAAADVRRTDAFPGSGYVRRWRQRFLDAISFANQGMNRRFADRPRAARLKPAATNFVMRELDSSLALL